MFSRTNANILHAKQNTKLNYKFVVSYAYIGFVVILTLCIRHMERKFYFPLNYALFRIAGIFDIDSFEARPGYPSNSRS